MSAVRCLPIHTYRHPPHKIKFTDDAFIHVTCVWDAVNLLTAGDSSAISCTTLPSSCAERDVPGYPAYFQHAPVTKDSLSA